MAFAIPKIEFKNGETTGNTTAGSGTIEGVASTENIEVGMFIRGSGIPSGALVESKTSDTITLSNGVLATADALGIDLEFGFEVSFDFPPKEPKGETIETNATTSSSLSGKRQVAVHNIEGIRTLTFSFVSPAVFILLDVFLRTHAHFGKAFRYYDDKTTTSFNEYELETLKTSPKKIAPRGVDTYVWEVPLTFRRVL